MSRCRICERPLKSIKSILAGIGPVCAAKTGQPSSTDKDDALVTIKEPMQFDVILSRGSNGEAITVEFPDSVFPAKDVVAHTVCCSA